MTMLLGVKRD